MIGFDDCDDWLIEGGVVDAPPYFFLMFCHSGGNSNSFTFLLHYLGLALYAYLNLKTKGILPNINFSRLHYSLQYLT
ncbi:MAG: hypothetical protein ACJA08_002688 [Cyclobacteriaceae bacterium]